LEFTATEYGRKGKVVASEDVKAVISSIGTNKCARESGFDRKNFIRKLIRNIPVKRNSYNEFVRWLEGYKLQHQILAPRIEVSEASQFVRWLEGYKLQHQILAPRIEVSEASQCIMKERPASAG
jgi:hypothetical protein